MTAFATSESAGNETSTLTTNPTAYGTYGVYGYNGEYTHTNLGLQYLRARYLNVATGTFTSRDTYAGRLQDILSQNRYTYAENNPVGRSDPSGHAPKKSGIGAMLQKTANTLTKMPMFTAPKARAATQASISNYMAEQNRKANNTEAQTASNQAFYNSARNAAHKEAEIRMDIWRFNMAGVAVMTANPGMVPWIESAATELEKANCAAYDWCINEIQKALIGKDAGRIAYGSSLILEGVGKVFGAAGLAKASTMVSATGLGTAIGIGGFAASAWLMACASADITQGAMEVYYGFKGDSLTPTVHVVKDSPIYGSNDLAYHLSTGVAASLGEIAGGLAAIRQPVSIKPDATSTNTLRQMDYNNPETMILYRGDKSTVTPDNVFNNGFVPKGTHNDPLLHTSSNTTPGNFVSTTANQEIANQFAKRNGYVYVIDTNNYIDINKTYGNMANYPEQMEFSIPGGIKPEEIVGAYRKQDGVIVGDFIPNPNYGGNN